MPRLSERLRAAAARHEVPVTRTIADILLNALRAFPVAGPGRRRCLLLCGIRFMKNGMLHQIADYDRMTGSWVSFCGVPYEGNGYEEGSHSGQVDCMICLTDADDVGR